MDGIDPDVIERAEHLRELQAYGIRQREAAGLDEIDVSSICDRVLAKKPNLARFTPRLSLEPLENDR